jgi:hypothetical protein
MRQRGGQFPGLSVGSGETGELVGISYKMSIHFSASVWSMPGGFTSSLGGNRDGYQPVEERAPAPPPSQSVAPPVPTTTQNTPGAYQNV